MADRNDEGRGRGPRRGSFGPPEFRDEPRMEHGWEQQDYASAVDRERANQARDRGWDNPREHGDFRSPQDPDRAYGASPRPFARSQGYGSSARSYEGSLRQGGYGYAERADAEWDRRPGFEAGYGYGQSQPQPSTPNYTGRGPKNWKRSDARIQEDVSEVLERHPGIDASDLEVEVREGVVTLTGTVPQREMKRMAEDVIESCAGVRDIQVNVRVNRDIGFSTNAGGIMVQNPQRATRGQENAWQGSPSTSATQAGTAAEARAPQAPARPGTMAGTPAEQAEASRKNR
jgi:HSP20 family molecular chaperone IbpA